ncbi:glycosyltransferase [Flavobacterium sp. LHD-85]|uniref:glycosyltransferase n=1 Tax=Flavobacterium sp. LHD-85 TaxID=3071410 RepID=UPI0027E17631|nr:glycosyltransferase [Flavobacterium sp. LHD-85]MDQ6529638.1 glycosyltransferase [Flavobacterium sp. LHD-85]
MNKFLIITSVIHTKDKNRYFGYGPYINEMNVWLQYVDQLDILAPLENRNITPIDLAYKFDVINFKRVASFSFTTIRSRFFALFKLPIIFWQIFLAMRQADHIHLRCPGNIGLIGCIVQIFFPYKNKTAKYAGNWDPKSNQPWTYKLQKRILNNSFLTRNMQVLVYGEWENQSKNIKSFFTATYSESEKKEVEKSRLDLGVKFIFVGSLVIGKNPLYAVELLGQLIKLGHNATLEMYGEGPEKSNLERYIQTNHLEDFIFLKGNQNKEAVKEAYIKSHFVILPSNSEGWPKAIAEGMFWGCLPIGTKVSCVPYMIDNGERGILLEMDADKDIQQLERIIFDKKAFDFKSLKALNWSRRYTLNVFQEEIKKVLLPKTIAD